MSAFTKTDEAYWIAKEQQIVPHLVDLGGYGFVIQHDSCRDGLCDDPRCLARKPVAEALVGARQALPEGHNFKVVDGWRPWPVQEATARRVEQKIRLAHPDWTAEQVDRHLWTMAPPARIVPKLASHRYGGALDLTVVAPDGVDLNMGVPLHYVTGPEAALLHYELRDDLAPEEASYRDNRRVLIRAMEAGGFEPYLAEFWHWGYHRDLLA
ncbi:MAG TPA: M15 family metallopeptidase [Phycisphaerae bacterium]|nr:M15 family metallopeptidase [Phycisphaerae bacterium]